MGKHKHSTLYTQDETITVGNEEVVYRDHYCACGELYSREIVSRTKIK